MKRDLRALAAAGALLTVLAAADAAFAQKQGGILRMYSVRQSVPSVPPATGPGFPISNHADASSLAITL